MFTGIYHFKISTSIHLYCFKVYILHACTVSRFTLPLSCTVSRFIIHIDDNMLKWNIKEIILNYSTN